MATGHGDASPPPAFDSGEPAVQAPEMLNHGVGSSEAPPPPINPDPATSRAAQPISATGRNLDKGKAPLQAHGVPPRSTASLIPPPPASTSAPAKLGGAATFLATGGQIPALSTNPRSNRSRASTWQDRNRGKPRQMGTQQQAAAVRKPDQPIFDTSAHNGKDPIISSNFIRYPPLPTRQMAPPHVGANSNSAAQHHMGQPIVDCQREGQFVNTASRDPWNGLAPMGAGHQAHQGL